MNYFMWQHALRFIVLPCHYILDIRYSWPRAPKVQPAQLLWGSGILGAQASLLISTAKDRPRQATPPGPSAQGQARRALCGLRHQGYQRCSSHVNHGSRSGARSSECAKTVHAVEAHAFQSCGTGLARRGGIARVRKPGREVSEEAAEAAGTGSALTWLVVASDPLSNDATSNKRRNSAA